MGNEEYPLEAYGRSITLRRLKPLRGRREKQDYYEAKYFHLSQNFDDMTSSSIKKVDVQRHDTKVCTEKMKSEFFYFCFTKMQTSTIDCCQRFFTAMMNKLF